jgi:hypothetical protein
VIGNYRRLWHGWFNRLIGPLNESRSAMLTHSLQTNGAVTVTTTQDDTRNPGSIGFGGRFE